LTTATYTRKFLTGRLHHPNTHYISLPPIPTTTSLHRTLDSTSSTLCFPLSGPGGRLALIPLDKPGRQSQISSISNGSALVDFQLCKFCEGVVCASDDGRVTLFSFQGEKKGGIKVDKVGQVEWHPFAHHLLGILDTGKSRFILWDCNSDTQRHVDLEYLVFPQ
jgi:hypothetical protein